MERCSDFNKHANYQDCMCKPGQNFGNFHNLGKLILLLYRQFYSQSSFNWWCYNQDKVFSINWWCSTHDVSLTFKLRNNTHVPISKKIYCILFSMWRDSTSCTWNPNRYKKKGKFTVTTPNKPLYNYQIPPNLSLNCFH